MSEDMSDMMNKINQMLKNNEMPDEIKNIVNQLSGNQKASSDMSYSPSQNGKTSSEENRQSNGIPDFDISTMLKMKSIIESMNQQRDDPRANLLMSLKPYLKPSRKQKVDQYVKLFQMGKVIEVLNPLGGDKGHDV